MTPETTAQQHARGPRRSDKHLRVQLGWLVRSLLRHDRHLDGGHVRADVSPLVPAPRPCMVQRDAVVHDSHHGRGA